MSMSVVGNTLHLSNLQNCANDTALAIELQNMNRGVEFVRFEWCGINGESMSKLVPIEMAKTFLKKGLNVLAAAWCLGAGGTIPPCLFCSKNGWNDGLSFADPSTFVPQLPQSAGKVGRVLIEPYVDGNPLPYPRAVARKLLRELGERGFCFYGCSETEFQQFHKDSGEPITNDIQIFHTLRNNVDERLMIDIAKKMKQVNVNMNTMNSEFGLGQQEWTITPSWGIAVADDTFVFKNYVKEIMGQNGYNATWMTRTDPSDKGCFNGGHFNFSVWESDRQHNAFYDPDTDGLSDMARAFIAGIMAHGPAITALCNPTAVCYDRIKPHNFAPCNVCWGMENRTCFLRAKAYDNSRTYFELRVPSSAANPYLVLCSVLAAGLHGLSDPSLVCPEPVTGDASAVEGLTKLPTTIEEALEALEADDIMREALSLECDGETEANLVELYCQAKRAELAALAQAGTEKADIYGWYKENFTNLI